MAAREIEGAVLIISSMVVYGHVGASAAAPVLAALGREAWVAPTVTLAHHPGHGPPPPGLETPGRAIDQWIAALRRLGRLERVAGVLTGYFVAPGQVAAAARAIDAVRAARPEARVLCDPVIGDDGAVYVREGVAEAVRASLIPRAHMATPNPFELAWLTGRDDPVDAARALRGMGPDEVVATSWTPAPERVGLALFSGGAPEVVSAPRLGQAPHGLGDAAGALYLGFRLAGHDGPEALARAHGALARLARRAAGGDELALARDLAAALAPSDAMGSKGDD